MQGTTRQTEDLIQDTKASVEDTARQAMRGAERTAEDVARASRQAADNVSEVTGEITSALEDSVRRNPLTTLGMVAVAGFIVGALWKS